MNTLKLQNPIKINGKEVNELTYDTSKITPAQFCEAEMLKTEASGRQPNMQPTEFDHSFHMYLGFMAVIAVNPNIDVKDLERLRGFDMIALARIGQNFTLVGAGGSAESGSDASSETTQEPSEPQSES